MLQPRDAVSLNIQAEALTNITRSNEVSRSG